MLTLKRKYFTSLPVSSAPVSVNNHGIQSRFTWLNQLLSWLIIPLLGIVLPNTTGLINNANYTAIQLLFQYSLFIMIALMIYKGNMFFLHNIKLRFNGSNMPYRKIVAIYFLVNIVYSGIISLASLSVWNRFMNDDLPFARPVITTTLVIIISVLFINNLYEIFYLQAVKEESEERMELLEEARLNAELQVLTSQIDPHFMYNALTSLSCLVQQKSTEVDRYNAMLADQYKYVLKNKCSPYVSLAEEMKFCQQYFSIQQLRFGNAVVLQVIKGDQRLDTLRVPPLSVQTLVENALKHNAYSEENPLLVQVMITGVEVRVSNNIQPITYRQKSTGTGLSNLNQRVKLLMKTSLSVEKTTDKFLVSLPLT